MPSANLKTASLARRGVVGLCLLARGGFYSPFHLPRTARAARQAVHFPAREALRNMASEFITIDGFIVEIEHDYGHDVDISATDEHGHVLQSRGITMTQAQLPALIQALQRAVQP